MLTERDKTKERNLDILIFLLNATWKENKDWICFVMLNTSEIFGIKSLDINQEEERIKFLRLFFLMRGRSYFDYSEEISERLLKGKYPKDFGEWKKLEINLKKYWEYFIDGFEKYPQHWNRWTWEEEKNINFSLILKKHKLKLNKKGEKIKWQEWETLIKASFAHDFRLLGEVICDTISYFSEERKIKKLSANEDNKFEISFDIEPEEAPDILIVSEKCKEEMWIEVVEVHSCSFELVKGKGKESFTNFIQVQLNNKIRESIKEHGETKLELIKKEVKIKGVKVIDDIKEKKEEKYFDVLWSIPEEVNNLDYLIENLKEAIEEKNKKWEERKSKGYKNLERTALWTVLSTAFGVKIYDKTNEKNLLINPEIQKDFFYLCLLEKVWKELSNTEVKFDYLIITFLNFHYSDKESFLDSHDPLYRLRREKAKEKWEILKATLKEYTIPRGISPKDISPDIFVEVTIPNLYIPIVNNKIKDLTDYIQEEKKIFKRKWIFDVDLLEYKEIPTVYSLRV